MRGHVTRLDVWAVCVVVAGVGLLSTGHLLSR